MACPVTGQYGWARVTAVDGRFRHHDPNHVSPHWRRHAPRDGRDMGVPYPRRGPADQCRWIWLRCRECEAFFNPSSHYAAQQYQLGKP